MPSTSRSAASSATSAQTSVPSTSTGRRASPSSSAISPIASGSGSTRARGPTTGIAEVAVANSSSIGTSTKTGPRCEAPATVNASSMPSATSAALWMVRASLETGAKIGGWSSSWRLPVPQRLAGARPPTTTIGEPPNRACATALRPLVTPGPAVSTASPGRAGELAGRLGGEGSGLLVPDVEDLHRRLGLHRPVVHREDVGAGEREHGAHPVGPRDRDGVLAGVAGELVAGVLGGASRASRRVVAGVGRGSLRHGRRLASSSARGPRDCRYAGFDRRSSSTRASSRSERTAGRSGASAAGGAAPAGTPGRCR